MFIDSDHAGNKLTRRSKTMFMTYINMIIINWYSIKQSSIEISVLGTEFVAMKVWVETLLAI